MPKPLQKPPEEGAPLWLLTYGDMVTLVLTFFVLLVSMMVVDPKKFVEVLGTFQEAGGDGSNIPQEVEPVPKEDFFIQIIKASTRRSPRPDGGEIMSAEGEAVRVFSHRENYVVELGQSSFFAPFEVALTEQGKAQLEKVADILLATNMNRVRLTGHYAPIEGPARFDALATTLPSGVRGLTRRFQEFAAEAGDLRDRMVFLNSSEDLAAYRAQAVREYLLRQGVAGRLLDVQIGGMLGAVIQDNIRKVGGRWDRAPWLELNETGTVREGSAESQPSLIKPATEGLALRAWPSFVFVEGGVDQGRTVSITVTGEIVTEKESYLRPLAGK